MNSTCPVGRDQAEAGVQVCEVNIGLSVELVMSLTLSSHTIHGLKCRCNLSW